MVRFSVILIFLAPLFFASCQTEPQESPPVDANAAYFESIKHLTGLTFQPGIARADSVQVIFYTNPDGDAKRYTRFYTLLPSTDSLVVTAMKHSVDKHFERLEKIRDCRSQGKIYFFAEGNPVQTVYFSNRGDSCNHLYFIADGWFYYMPMDSSTALTLKALRADAAEPVSFVE